MSDAENAVEKAAQPTCSTCPSFYDDPAGNVGQCRYEPPKVHLVPMQSKLNGPALQPVALWPPVGADAWCSCHPDLQEAEIPDMPAAVIDAH